jgi:hypothetical protein
MTRPSDEVRAELEQLLAADESRLGDVYRLDQRGMSAQEIAAELGVSTSGFVSNYRTRIKAILDGRAPASPNIARELSSRIRAMTRASSVSGSAQRYFDQLLVELDKAAKAPSVRSLNRPTGVPARQTAAVSTSARPQQPGSLRQLTDTEVRARLTGLISEIESDVGISVDDYRSALGAEFLLDGVANLVMRNRPCATSETLLRAGESQLTLEHAILGWSSDLPISAELIGYAGERLKFWRS